MDNSDLPIPVEPLDYQFLEGNFRPGILTAVGIISIVMACIGALSDVSGIISSTAFYYLSRMPMPVATPPTTSPVVVGSSGRSFFYTATATASPGPTTMPATLFPFSIDRPSLELAVVTGVIGILLSILLLVAGIKVLRNSRGGERLHRFFIWVKIPLVVLSAVGTWLWNTSLYGGMNGMNPSAPGMPPGFASVFAVISAVVVAAFSLVYPISLIFVLSSKRVRTYFDSLS